MLCKCFCSVQLFPSAFLPSAQELFFPVLFSREKKLFVCGKKKKENRSCTYQSTTIQPNHPHSSRWHFYEYRREKGRKEKYQITFLCPSPNKLRGKGKTSSKTFARQREDEQLHAPASAPSADPGGAEVSRQPGRAHGRGAQILWSQKFLRFFLVILIKTYFLLHNK